MKVLLIDVARCSGCTNCQLACKDEHCGNDWRPYAAAQPMTGQFWCRVNEHAQGTIPKVRIHYISTLCAHCLNAPCMDVCPESAIERRADGLVLISPERCSGCGKCAEACPIDAIFMNQNERIAQKCTGCAHLLDNGLEKPRCVEACPTDAMRIIEDSELPDNAVPAVDGALGGRLYYINIPGRFIGATVYDPVEKEVVIGAVCRLTGGGEVREEKTDDFGDFWFNDLPVGSFDLVIEAEGFKAKTFPALSTEDSLNLGDVPLERNAE